MHASLRIAILICLFALPNLVAAEQVALTDIAPEYMGDGLEVAVIPTPQKAKLGNEMFVAARLEIEATKDYRHPATVKDAQRWAAAASPGKGEALKVLIGELGDGGPADRVLQAIKLMPTAEKRTAMGEQGYVLFVGNSFKNVPTIAVAGVGPAGTYYGVQTLKQLTIVKNGNVHVRSAQIIDWPAMPWRGSKRPLAWEELYKANFGPLRGDDNKEHFRVFFGAGVDPQRGLKSWEAPGTKATASRGLDASDAYIDGLFKQWEAEFRKTGNRLFTVKGDDIELALDEKSGTRERFKGSYGAAFVHLLTELNRRVKKLDPACTIYWMPNPYYTVNWDFELLSRQVREAGGLPSDTGLWWTGHYVFSGIMTAEDISGYQKAFYGNNQIKVRGFIYDNHGRADEPSGRLADFFAMPARDPDIATYLNGMMSERGSWINRITSYDFQWNPKAYKPERSLKLAVRELTNRDPTYYKLVMEFVETWESGRYPSTKETTHDAIAKQQKALVARLNELKPKLQAAGQQALKQSAAIWDPRDGDFRQQFLGQMVGNIGAKEGHLTFLEQMWRDAPGAAFIIPSSEAPKIDGKLDDACYKRAPTLDRFITNGGKMTDATKKTLWEVTAGTVPDDISTQGWYFADDKNFYMAFRCNDKRYPRPAGQRINEPTTKEKVGNDYPYCWRQWCLDINLDVKHDHLNAFHLIFDPLGQVYDEYLGWPGDTLPTGPPWSLGDNYKVVRDGDSWVVEAAIPLEKLGLKQVKPGDVWGTNVYRNGINVVSMFSLLKDTGPYGVRYPKVFGNVQWK